MNIVLISCSAKKQNGKKRAVELYQGSLFKKSYLYAKKIGAERIFILSAKYGLVETEDEIESYDQTLNKMSQKEKMEWAKMVVKELKEKTDFQNDNFIFLAGKNYRENIIPKLNKYDIPMKGLGIGKQLKWLTMQI